MAVSLITGGAGGIGREISFSFARHGYDVGIHYNQAKERAETLASEIRSIFGVRVQTFHADLSKPAEIAEMFQNAESTLGAPDVLINNAGLSDQRLFTDVSAEDWQRLLDVNLSGTFHTVNAQHLRCFPENMGRSLIYLQSGVSLGPLAKCHIQRQNPV